MLCEVIPPPDNLPFADAKKLLKVFGCRDTAIPIFAFLELVFSRAHGHFSGIDSVRRVNDRKIEISVWIPPHDFHAVLIECNIHVKSPGWLKGIGAANTDLVFGVVSDELGLLMALCAVAVILLLALAAFKSAAGARSTFYVIAACSTAMLFVVQTMLNVFGSVDLLPLTGVTFPFLSMGGSSMICCWGLLAYIKAADTRQNAALAVRLPSRKAARAEQETAPQPADDDIPFPRPDDTHYDADDWQNPFVWEEDDDA